MTVKTNQSSVFGLATILAFLNFPILAQTPAGVPSLDKMAGEWLPMKDVANPPDVNNFHDMLIIGQNLTSFFCNPGDWLWGMGRWKVERRLSTGHADDCGQGISGDGMSLVSLSRVAP